ncbi:MAG: O-antigen ligase family protein [Candidatus Coatesbacteria bacterium]
MLASVRLSGRLAALLWLTLAGLLPVAFYPGGQSPFGPVKRDVFCILAFCQFLLTAVRWGPGWRDLAQRLEGVPALPPAAAVAVFALAGQAAGIGGARPPAEVLDLILGAGLCVCLLADPAPAPAGKVLGAIAAGTGLASCYAVAQYWGADPYTWLTGFAGGAPGATYGNPLFLGDGLVLALPVALAGILACGGALRAASFGLALLLGFVLLLTQARGGWLGTAIGLAVFAWGARTRIGRISPARRGQAARWFAVWAGAGIAAAVLLSLPGPWNPGGGSVAVVARSLLHPGESGLSGRLLIWESTARMTRDRPLAGWGPGTVKLLYGLYQAPLLATPRYASLPLRSTLHAHNDLLQALAERGVVGLGVFLWLLAAVAATCTAGRSAGWARPAAGAGLVAWLVDGLVNGPLHLPPSSMQIWILLGLLGRRGEAIRGRRTGAPRPRMVFAIPAVIAALVFCRPFARDLLAEGWLQEGAFALDRGEALAALTSVARADAFALEDRRHRFLAGCAWYALGRWDEAARAFGDDAERNPGAHSAWFNLGLSRWSAGRRVAAREPFRRALALKPGDGETMRLLRAVQGVQGSPGRERPPESR